MGKLIGIGLCAFVSCSLPRSDAQETVPVIKRGDQSFVECQGIGRAIEMEFKLVQPGKLATYCSSGAEEICIPVRLSDSNHVVNDSEIYLLTDEAESVLSVEITISGRTASVSSRPSDRPSLASPGLGYNADWPTGRGFSEGNTVPDIPLMSMDGREIRFSEYLGKRYILYCWASW